MAPELRVAGLPPQVRLAPGAEVRLALRVTNGSTVVDAVNLALEGLHADWYTLAGADLSLFPGDSAQVDLLLHPPSSVDTLAGSYPFEVHVASRVDPTQSATAASSLGIEAVGRLGVEVRPQVAQGRAATFRVTWQNRSNRAAAVALEARDAEQGLEYRLDPDGEIDVAPGAEATVEVRVWPRHRETVGEPHRHEIEFRGLQPGTSDLLAPSLIGHAQYTYVPRFRALMLPLWLRRLPIWALLILLLLLLALLLLAGNRTGGALAGSAPTWTPTPSATATPTPRPTATATATATTVPLPRVTNFGLQVDAKGAVTVAWAVAGSGAVSLNGRAVAPNGSMPITVKQARTLVLRATNGGGGIAQILEVAPPPTRRLSVALPPQRLGLPIIAQFSTASEPRTGALTLTWQVRGADRVLLNKAPVAAGGTARIPEGGPSSYVLRAQNAAGMASAALALPSSPALVVRTLAIHLPAIAQFALQPPRSGRPYALIWRTRNALRVTLNGAAVAASGSLALQPPIHAGHYVLIAANDRGQVTSRVEVVVQ